MAYENSGFTQPPFFLENLPESRLSLDHYAMGRQNQQNDLYHGDFDLNTLDPSLISGQNHSVFSPPQQSQQHPMARFESEQQRSFFTMPTLYTQPQQLGAGRRSAPVNTLPYASQGRIASPSPSQGLTSSSCSSALTPPADTDYYQDHSYYSPGVQIPNDFSVFDESSPFHTRGPSSWSESRSQSYSSQQFSASNPGCVNMSQVQQFADPEEVTFKSNEGYNMGGQDYSVGMNDGHTIQVETSRQNSYYVDEGLGSSIHDNPTPKSMAASYHEQDSVNEEDMDAEGEQEDTVIVDTADDTDYTPSSKSPRRNKTRRAAKSFNPLSANNKSARVAKSSPKTKGPYLCKSCDAGPFKDPSSLSKHVAHAHTRAFACVFSFAGCSSTFGSKNEWKRHVQSQHLNLVAWVCTQGSCGKVHGPSNNPNVGSEFNRKDLFTQHVRRMHVPVSVKKKLQAQAAKAPSEKVTPDTGFEATLKKLQIDCSVIKRQGPEKLRCPVYGCDTVFQGANPWDERMEHVGKHVEKSSKGSKVEIRSERDSMLVDWALREGVIETKSNGSFRLCVSGLAPTAPEQHGLHAADHSNDDEDAEGEADD